MKVIDRIGQLYSIKCLCKKNKLLKVIKKSFFIIFCFYNDIISWDNYKSVSFRRIPCICFSLHKHVLMGDTAHVPCMFLMLKQGDMLQFGVIFLVHS